MKLEDLQNQSMVHHLDVIKSFVDELKESNSGNYKKEVLAKWFNSCFRDFIEKLCHYLYDYDKQYYVTSSNILKHWEDKRGLLSSTDYRYIFALLDDLNTRKITGNKAIYACIDFIKTQNEEYKDLILNIIDKDLQIGVSETTINKIIPGLIKTFDVCLANKYDPDKHILDNNWVIERKLDGVRCILIYKNENDIKCWSRQGKEITTLGKLINEIKGKLPDNTVLDGEMCLVDDQGNEDFQSIMKVIRRKDYTIENPMYKVFDMLTIDEFEGNKTSCNYLCRYSKLSDFFYNNPNLETMSKVELQIYSPEILKQWEQRVLDNNWEGLMFRKNVPYEGKRSDNLLKYKKFQDAEYVVKDIEISQVQDIVNGIATKIEAVGSLIIEHKGNKVGVGTGLSLEQRKRWLKHPEEIIGRTVTIKFFEETVDQNGKPSLRFPVLKCVYDKDRDV